VFKVWLVLIAFLLPLTGFSDWRDPTTPANSPSIDQEIKPNGESVLNLTAILVTENGRYATINGKTVKSGGFLDSTTRLLKIMPNYVLIRQHDTTQKIYLVPSVKKPLK